jgi:hypothetical protein
MTTRTKLEKHIGHNVTIDILYSGAVTLDCVDCEALLTMWKLENDDEKNDWEKKMTATMTPCPNHEGAYDCTPFCEVCSGNQEIESEV